MHPRNKHINGYNINALKNVNKGLKQHVTTANNRETINFSDPKAVFELNKSLLLADYKLKYWQITPNSLCPAVPGRADYIHHIADLLAKDNNDIIPRGSSVNILDIGTGSSLIYPIIGAQEYEWNFVASEIESSSVDQAQANINKNIWLKKKIELRSQNSAEKILKGIIKNNENFDAIICNPPFYKSREDNWTKSTKKFQNLNKGTEKHTVQNFAGHPNELWCPGGEQAFITKLIYESKDFQKQIKWTSSLVSNKDHLKPLISILEYHKTAQIEIINMKQGQKNTRILAWRWS